MKEDTISFSTNGQAMNTVFGLTTTRSDGIATISDINFYTRNDLVTYYPEMQQHLGAPDNGISPIIPTSTHKSIYTLSGLNVTGRTPLTPGIYIVDGQLRIHE